LNDNDVSNENRKYPVRSGKASENIPEYILSHCSVTQGGDSLSNCFN